nr:MAG TPA: Nuclease [Bacteriophage sp.]
MLMRKTEENLHLKVCDYLRKNYPDVLFRTDFSSGMKMTPGQAAKHKKFQKSRAWPDLFIAKSGVVRLKDDNNDLVFPRNGMFLELKAEGTKLYKKNGEMVANKHYREQAEMLKKLRSNRYAAYFAVGYDQAIQIITDYLGEPKPKKVEF